MKRIDFTQKLDFTQKPDFDNGHSKWYRDKHFTMWLNNQQAENLPVLENMGCFVVKGPDYEDYVLIDDKQNVIVAYPYTGEGYGQMEARINIMKISKHYDEQEALNV